MSGHTKTLSVMVLTEDSGADAYDTVRALVKEMLRTAPRHGEARARPPRSV